MLATITHQQSCGTTAAHTSALSLELTLLLPHMYFLSCFFLPKSHAQQILGKSFVHAAQGLSWEPELPGKKQALPSLQTRSAFAAYLALRTLRLHQGLGRALKHLHGDCHWLTGHILIRELAMVKHLILSHWHESPS